MRSSFAAGSRWTRTEMPVQRFRDFDEARRALEEGPRASLATFLALSHFACRVRLAGGGAESLPSSRGVHRFRSLDEAQEDRLRSAT